MDHLNLNYFKISWTIYLLKWLFENKFEKLLLAFQKQMSERII